MDLDKAAGDAAKDADASTSERNGWVTRPEWRDVRLGGNHHVTVSLVGQRVVVSQPTGYATLESLIPALDLVAAVAREVAPANSPFIWIADYSCLSGSSRESRKYFAEATATWSRLHTLILCGLSPILSVAARLATKLRLVHYDVLFADDLDEALRIAREVTAAIEVDLESRQHAVHEASWELALDGFRVSMNVVDDALLVSEVGGRFEEHHVEPLFELQQKVFAGSGLHRRDYAIVVDLERLESVSYRARHHYLGRMTRWFEERPFAVEVFCNANPLLQAALDLTRPFAPFVAKAVPDRRQALELARQYLKAPETLAASAPKASQKAYESADIKKFVDQLLDLLSEVNWDVDRERSALEFEQNHPFAPVFYAIELLRSELQDLLRDKESSELAHRKLTERLARARKMEALGLLAGGVAHDLNNVLSGIVTYPDFLLMRDDLDEDTRAALRTIKRSGDQAAAIVNDLVTIARGVAVNTQPVLLEEVVEDYLESPQFERLREYHPWVEVNAALPVKRMPITGSHVHLKKVVMNLVSNATEAIPEERGPGFVEVSTEFRYVDPAQEKSLEDVQEGEYVVLSVRDNGPGIAPQELERIFEPFYTKKVMGRSGTGLGLTVVWNTVQDHGGHVDVESGDTGTCFRLYFPVTRESVVEARTAPAVAEYMGHGERLLLVDDVENQREIAARMLTALGYTVDTAASGEEAVEMVRGSEYDLLILDMIMDPGINGRETFERIRAFKPEQKAVITSGFSQTEEVAEAQRLGAGRFVGKPYSLEAIGLAIRAELEGGGEDGAG